MMLKPTLASPFLAGPFMAAPLLAAMALAFQAPSAIAQDDRVDAECVSPSPEAAAFLDGVVEDMVDPESGFTHTAILGTPEIQEIQETEKARLLTDWGNVCKYRADNRDIMDGPAPRAVFIGDSITEFWSAGDPALFGPGIVNRGISGQTSSQMLVRFWPDVVALKPGAVHIMAGTNDLAENTGHVSDETYQNNIRAMVSLAQANGISVILASIPPAGSFGWRPELTPDVRIATLNKWLEAYADETGAVFVDYHSLLSTDGSAMSPDLTHDGVHPHSLGYAAMNEAATKAIEAALADAD